VVAEWTDLSREGNEDVIATDVRRRGERITRIFNLYHQKNTHSQEGPAQKLNLRRVIWLGGALRTWDFNVHRIRWDPRFQVQQDAVFWEDVIDQNGMDIGNDGEASHHWAREGYTGESVIQLTLANQTLNKWSIPADDHATGSHHNITEWEVEVDRPEEAGQERVVGWNLAAIIEKDMKAAEKLWMELLKERALLDAEFLAAEVEQEAAWC
jgi:hypothetical protein